MNKRSLLPLQILFVIFAACTRLAPHPANFTPVLAIGLFAGFHFKSRLHSLLIPLAVMLVSDYFLGFYMISFWVYLSISGIALSSWYINKYYQKKYLVLSSFASSLFFFIISNFGVWSLGGYGYSIQGLVSCYVMAIPFFFNTAISTLLYTFIFFGCYEFIVRFFQTSFSKNGLIDP